MIWKRVLFALIIVTLASAMRIWPLQILETRLAWLTFYPAVGVVALYGGFFAGLLTAILACLIVTFLWPLLAAEPFIVNLRDWIGLTVFFLTSCMISGMAGALRSAQVRATEAKTQAEAANRSKSLFLATMSHELRTPLNAILGFSAILLNDSTLTKEQYENIQIINRSGEYLLNLINDILDMAKIEAGRVALEIKSFNIRSLINDLRDMLDIRAKEKGLELRVDISPEVPHFINTDDEKLRQIIINLTSNAIKFTDHGYVSLHLHVQQQEVPQLIIEVEDSGIGISKDELKRIFEAFVQVGHSSTQKGTGLGLSIVRKYIEIMGGKIDVESTLNKGSLFRIHLPIQVAGRMEEPLPTAENENVVGLEPEQPEYRILIVEDQRENRLLLQQLLSNVGFKVEVAENGKDGIELFQRYHPHFIWMDRSMPVMDGVETIKRIRTMPGGKKVKIAGVSALALTEQREELLAAGADDFITKPYHPSSIFNCLTKHLGVRYIYQKKKARKTNPLDLSISALAKLSKDLRCELMDGLVFGNPKRLLEIVHRIEDQDTSLAKVLTVYIESFNYQPLLDALETIDKEKKDNE